MAAGRTASELHGKSRFLGELRLCLVGYRERIERWSGCSIFYAFRLLTCREWLDDGRMKTCQGRREFLAERVAAVGYEELIGHFLTSLELHSAWSLLRSATMFTR